MNGRIIYRIFLGVVLLAVVAGLGLYAYNLGIAQGVAQSGNLPTPAPGVAPYPYFYGPFFFRPFGFPFLFCLIPLFFFLVFGLLFRGLFWHGPWWYRGGHHGNWEGGVPPRFEEWHRRAHEPKADEGSQQMG